nr:hypothetical protein [Tanacetum cinerariifolium]GEZ96633.1 hypothetical protein [Tanacetum cinerariifolium]
EDTEAFETNESAPTPVPSPRRRTSKMSKRSRFTAPTGRFEVRESSSAVARQAGHTLAHTVDYGFIDTMDASICVAERRAMTAMGVVNDWVIDLTTTQRQDARELNAWSHSKSMIQAMEAQIRSLQRDVDVLQRQRIRDKDRVVAYIQHEHDRKYHQTKEPPQQPPSPHLYRSRNGDDDHNLGSDRRRRMPVVRECTYSDFLKCQPLNFKGNALTWWNSHVKTLVHDVAYAMTRKALKKMTTDKYCPRELALMCSRMFPEESDEVEKYVGGVPDIIQGSVMASKPKKMRDAIEFATELMDQKICTLLEQ